MNDDTHIGTILAEVLLLTVVVILVDERWIRAALAFVPALLLAQRALKPTKPVGQEQGPVDPDVQEHTKELLEHFRDFYGTCHRVVQGEITPAQAVDRSSHVERNLNQLLNRIRSG